MDVLIFIIALALGVGMVGWCIFVMDCKEELRRMHRAELRRKMGVK